ncbi:MAG TPA: thioredoxin domain-containing protein [Propionibacteriaceae bacterium]|nr:thioredoxin domain-containing protein [Propionibacteriaceae bacterium]
MTDAPHESGQAAAETSHSPALPAPGMGWNPGGAVTPRPTATLPWVISAVLAAVCLLLAGMLGSKSNEVSRLRQDLAAATPVATASVNPSANPASPSAAQTPDQEVLDVMLRLPRRIEGDALAEGAVDAPVILIEWSDFRCPFCAVWATTTRPALQPYIDSGSLRVEYRDLVLFGDESTKAALGARAAGEQGKFWEFYDALFAAAPTSGHPTVTDAIVLKHATEAGVGDLAQFTKDYASAELKAAVEKDTAEARSLGITGPPFFLINTTTINGAQPTANFIALIEKLGATK